MSGSQDRIEYLEDALSVKREQAHERRLGLDQAALSLAGARFREENLRRDLRTFEDARDASASSSLAPREPSNEELRLEELVDVLSTSLKEILRICCGGDASDLTEAKARAQAALDAATARENA